MRRTRQGFSLLELLICIAIIGILMGMFMSAFSKALRKAKSVAGVEAVRQDFIGEAADNANFSRSFFEPPLREQCREAFYQELTTSQGPRLYTELLYVVRNEDQFRAYWHTLIDPDAEDDPEYQGRFLIAYDEDGSEFILPPRGKGLNASDDGLYPIGWEFLSTSLADMTSGNIGTNVLWSDGHVEYIPYGARYPSCRTVAKLSKRFLDGQ
jgi:prepilin-type N-terminal cleavage/methylation domain-containing protein/prepilin-type processing-associated H-X9-DG protein